MKRAPIASALLVLILASASIAAERTPAGSFLKYRATSVQQLSNEIIKDTTACARYAQHFGVSPDELNEYITKNLKLVALDKPLKVRTYYIGRNGRIYTKTKLYPKGTMVFASKDGKPVLAWSCGNPLSTALPTQEPKVAAVSGSVETKVLANPVETITAAAITAPPTPEVVAVAPVAAPPPVAAMAMPPVAVPPALGAKFPLFWLPMLFPHHHHNPPVPEPGSLIAMGTGLVGLTGFARLRKRR